MTGRPSKHAKEATRTQLTLTVPAAVKNRLVDSSAASGRILSQEATYYLEMAFLVQDLIKAGLLKPEIKRQVMP